MIKSANCDGVNSVIYHNALSGCPQSWRARKLKIDGGGYMVLCNYTVKVPPGTRSRFVMFFTTQRLS